MIEARATRRELVSRAVAAAAGSALLAPEAAAAAAAGAAESDAEILTAALGVEQLVAIAYRRALSSGVLAPAVARQVSVQRRHELEHIDALERALRAMGSPVPAAPASLAAAEKGLAAHHVKAGLGNLSTQHDCLVLLVDVESAAEAAYFSALAKLSDIRLLEMAAEIMGCEAQHWSVLSAISHRDQVYRYVPYPFVEGAT